MFNYAILLPYIGMVFLLGGCAALDKAMVPTSADTEINLKNDRVAVIVDACRYWSTMAFADNYFSKADALKGKMFAFRKKYVDHQDFKGAIYKGNGVIRDGNIITSGTCPMRASKGFIDGTQEVQDLLSLRLMRI